MPHIPRSTTPATGDDGPFSSEAKERKPIEKSLGLEQISLRRWQVDPTKILEHLTTRDQKPEKAFRTRIDPKPSR